MSAWSRSIRADGGAIGLVPTMGYFHEGHVSLMRTAKSENDRAVVSLFVNPAQFGRNEDLTRYPRDFGRDSKLAESAGVDVLFSPDAKAIYPDGYRTYVEVNELGGVLCGAARPGHFRGVTTIVAKFFHIVNPHTAYFGQKDYQQSVIIRRMASDLNLEVTIKVLPTVREPDGLAMSSRNTYLSPEERAQAPALYRGLLDAERAYRAGEHRAAALRRKVEAAVQSAPAGRIEYIEVVHPETLHPLGAVGPEGAVIALAVFIGKTRLIDNIIVKERT